MGEAYLKNKGYSFSYAHFFKKSVPLYIAVLLGVS
jgi:hypothetical protein